MFVQKVKNFFEKKLKRDYSNVFLPVALLWFSIRVVPKPSRVAYPCQRATLTLVFVKFAVVFATLATATTALSKKRTVKMFSVLALVGVLLWEPATTLYYQARYAGVAGPLLRISDVSFGFPSNKVVRVHSQNATSWDFSSGYYWQYIDQSVVDLMVEEGVKSLTGASDAQTAWQTIMSSYVSGDKVGIKINGNDWWNSDQREIDAIPQMVNSVIKGLKSIGVPETDIYIIENTDTDIAFRRIPDYYKNIVTPLYPDVVFQYDTSTNPTFGTVADTQVNFPYSPGTKRINDQIAEKDHLILMPIMKAITPSWGITGAIKLMQGLIEDVSSFHGELDRTSADNPDVLIYQNPHIMNKTRLIISDGLFGAWTGQHFTGGYGGIDDLNSPVDDIPKQWITFSNEAPNLLFFAVDPVAVDSVMYDHLLNERNAQEQVSGQTMAPFQEPQLLAGAAAGLGIREHGPPYSSIDYVEIELGEASPPSAHDIAVTNVAALPNSVVQGGRINATVTVANQGNNTEVFDVSAYYNQNLIGTQTGINLAAGATQDLTFSWDTTAVAVGTYTLRAQVPILSGETDTADNSRSGETVSVYPTPVHDVAITSVSASPVTVLPGQIVNVTVVARNEGTESETFIVTAFANTTAVGMQNTTLASGDSSTLIFSWNTTNALGVYEIKAEAGTVGGETDTADNTRWFDGAVAVFTRPVQFPSASFVYSPQTPTVEETIAFNASSSSDPDGNIVNYLWDFGDGETDEGMTATHAYLFKGNYTVTLTVRDNDGLSDTAANQVSIVEKPPVVNPPAPTVRIDYILISVTVAAVALATVALLYFRRRVPNVQ